MKTYKDFEKIHIGGSDIASLLFAGPSTDPGSTEWGMLAKFIPFGQDGEYHAYIVKGEAEIRAHYHLEATFQKWMRIYEDDGKSGEFKGDEIRVYRAKEMGCIIQIL